MKGGCDLMLGSRCWAAAAATVAVLHFTSGATSRHCAWQAWVLPPITPP